MDTGSQQKRGGNSRRDMKVAREYRVGGFGLPGARACRRRLMPGTLLMKDPAFPSHLSDTSTSLLLLLRWARSLRQRLACLTSAETRRNGVTTSTISATVVQLRCGTLPGLSTGSFMLSRGRAGAQEEIGRAHV